ncbi:phage head closure protein [Antarcticirhabdus aurantiaca]|uniref:Phage head closure protein n=1 Tax=Antarcticirhabdus aurantiaca TaxID=2606717 RepID=A0ACD4NHP1_9HYPH|nr:phage head closure protein [Jeongeuplla avenae]
MRAGKLDKTITIERSAASVDEYGTPSEGWSPVATVRAQVIQATTEEFMRSFGQASEAAAVFRIRHLDGITPGDRVTYQGRPFDIKEVKELGRRAGIDLRCVAQGA